MLAAVMARPRLLTVVPNRLKERLYYRLYRAQHSAWPELFQRAPLALCPEIAMYDLIPGDVISGCIAFKGFYDWDLTKRMAQHARCGGLFVDVGANMGYFSLLWTCLNPSNRAIAFEASPRNISLFRNNVERNHLGDRITIIPKAAGDRSGTAQFEIGPSDQTGWGGMSLDSQDTISVPMTRLDDEIAEEKIDILKIDTEGADTLVILGCERLLRDRRIQHIYFEQNMPRMKQLGIEPGTAQKFLETNNYRCRSLGGDAWTATPA